jgi:hypothetical protein
MMEAQEALKERNISASSSGLPIDSSNDSVEGLLVESFTLLLEMILKLEITECGRDA